MIYSYVWNAYQNAWNANQNCAYFACAKITYPLPSCLAVLLSDVASSSVSILGACQESQGITGVEHRSFHPGEEDRSEPEVPTQIAIERSGVENVGDGARSSGSSAIRVFLVDRSAELSPKPLLDEGHTINPRSRQPS